jgi:hypothetical protein
MTDEFVVINNTAINLSRVLAVHHDPGNGQTTGYVIREHYLVMFDDGQKLSLKPVDGQPLIERFRNLAKPSLGTTQTTSGDAT